MALLPIATIIVWLFLGIYGLMSRNIERTLDLLLDTKLTDTESYTRVSVYRYPEFSFGSMGVDHGGEWYYCVPVVSSRPPRLQQWL